MILLLQVYQHTSPSHPAMMNIEDREEEVVVGVSLMNTTNCFPERLKWILTVLIILATHDQTWSLTQSV